MPHDENLRALLDAAAQDPTLEHAVLLLDALVQLPLSDTDWRDIATVAHALLSAWVADPARARGLSSETWLGVLVRIPLASVRGRLRSLARGPEIDLALSAARALTTQRDAGGLAALIRDFSLAPSEPTALALARLPEESLRDARGVLSSGLAATDPMVRLWAAIALAKSQTHGAPRSALGTIERLWNGLMRPPEGSSDPSLFWGSPWRTVATLSQARPLPIQLRAFLLSLKDRDFDGDWQARDPALESSVRKAQLLVAGLTGAYDADGHPALAPDRAGGLPPADPVEAERIAERLLLAPWRSAARDGRPAGINLDHHERVALRVVPEALAARLVHAAVDSIKPSAREADQRSLFQSPEGVGNALLDLVVALPAGLPLDLDRLLDDAAPALRAARDALAWIVARAGVDPVLATMGRRIVVGTGEQRLHELRWLHDIAKQMGAPPPYQGAGGEERTIEPRPLLDDGARMGVPTSPEGVPKTSRSDESILEGRLGAAPPALLGGVPMVSSPADVSPPANVSAAERSPSPVEAPEGSEPVDVAVFCPGQVAQGYSFLVQVFLYPPPSAAEVAVEARQADDTADRRGKMSLPLDLPPGTRVDLHLEMPALIITEPDAVVVWRGRSTAAQFDVSVPATAAAAQAIGRVRIALAGTPIATLRFVVTVVATGTAPQPAEPREVRARRYRNAFVSYSSADRAEVLRRVQAFRIAGLTVFQDILDLEPGERWERALYRHIDECDVFLLFWSRAAAASPWVSKEIEYALARKAENDENPPDIQPVPLEGPPLVPPPPGLSAFHFNDALLAHIRAADRAATTRPQPPT